MIKNQQIKREKPDLYPSADWMDVRAVHKGSKYSFFQSTPLNKAQLDERKRVEECVKKDYNGGKVIRELPFECFICCKKDVPAIEKQWHIFIYTDQKTGESILPHKMKRALCADCKVVISN